MKVFFFPGLGADASLAKYHTLPGYDVVWLNWPKHFQNSWEQFEIDLLKENNIENGAVFIGISFGGMVAQRIAQFKKPICIILISSLTVATSISPMLRAFKPIVNYLPEFLFNMNLLPKLLAGWFFGIKEKEDISLLYEMANKLRPIQFKCLNQLALSFQTKNELGLPIFRIHGKKDRMILAKSELREKIIPNGGHLISMTHSNEVNSSIIQWIEQAKSGARPKRN
jgi:pimeloyl-ACP methyl ester carboxylesterase